MNILSINYKQATLEIRSYFSFTKEEIQAFREDLFKEISDIRQCVVLSTCNRCEIFVDGNNESVVLLQNFLCKYKNVDYGSVVKLFNVFIGEKAIEHLTKVACGIDSMVLGEDEILRQIKEAYQDSLDSGATGYEFNTIFQMAISAAKDIKTSTGLSETPVSIATLAANIVFSLPKENKKVLIIGITGKIGSITALNIAYKEDIEVFGTVRKRDSNLNTVESLASNKNLGTLCGASNVTFVDYDSRYEYMEEADVVISATSSPHYTITKEDYDLAIKSNRNRIFIDLAVPQDIDSRISEYASCKVYNIDYFKKLASDNNQLKKNKAIAAADSAKAWADKIEKELIFHDIVEIVPELQKMVQDKGIEKMIYSLRKLADKNQIDGIARWLYAYLENA